MDSDAMQVIHDLDSEVKEIIHDLDYESREVVDDLDAPTDLRMSDLIANESTSAMEESRDLGAAVAIDFCMSDLVANDPSEAEDETGIRDLYSALHSDTIGNTLINIDTTNRTEQDCKWDLSGIQA